MRISDWSSDVCSSDLEIAVQLQLMVASACARSSHSISEIAVQLQHLAPRRRLAGSHSISEIAVQLQLRMMQCPLCLSHSISEIAVQLQQISWCLNDRRSRSEEHTSELQSLMRISY